MAGRLQWSSTHPRRPEPALPGAAIEADDRAVGPLAARPGVPLEHCTYVGQAEREVERGRRSISLHNILKIAEGLGIDPGPLVRELRAPEE